MTHYRFFSLDSAGRVLGSFDATCANDKEACSRMEGFQKAGAQIEVWSGSRFVGKIALRVIPKLHASDLLRLKA